MPYKDKEKARACWRAWYARNVAIERVRTRAKTKANGAVIKALIRHAKSKPCMDCGNTYPHYVMDFDHVRGTKDRNISNTARNGWSVERLQAEIAKCDLVCANCHRIRTFTR